MVYAQRSLNTKINFILQLGYFKAKSMFFVFDLKMIEEDAKYVLDNHFPQLVELPKQDIHKNSRLFIQNKILQLFNYRLCDQTTRAILQTKATQLAKICTKPIHIFNELVKFLESQRIILPGYSFFQEEIVGRALTLERARLETMVQRRITPDVKSILQGLLEANDDLYALTILKKEPKDFKFKEMSFEIQKCINIGPLFDFASRLLEDLEISNENIRYNASLVDYYTVYKLKRMSKGIVYLYLLCFVYSRYQRIKDNLINCLIYFVRKYLDAAKLFAREQVYAQKIEGNNNLSKTGKILDIFVDETISDDTKFGDVKKHVFSILPQQKISFMSRYIAKTKFDEGGYIWEYHLQNAKTIKKNLRPVFMNINFESHIENDPLLDGVQFMKAAFQRGKSLNQFNPEDFPQEFIPTKLKRYIYESKIKKFKGNARRIKMVNGDKYEFLIYQLLMKHLEAGDVFSRDSIRFRSFEDDLVSNARWEQKEIILKELDLPALSIPIERQLVGFKAELEAKYSDVNRRILTGENKYIKIIGMNWI